MGKRYWIPFVAFTVIFLGCAIYVNFFASPITDGPLAMAAEPTKNSWTDCTVGKIGETMFFGSDVFPASPDYFRDDTVTITSIKPVKLPPGLKQVGMGIRNADHDGEILGGSLKWEEDQSSYPIQKLPVTLTLNKHFFQPIITVVAVNPGVYTIPGLIVTYTDHGRRYSDYFRGQFVLTTQSSCPSNPSIAPITLPGTLPRWLAWMRVK